MTGKADPALDDTTAATQGTSMNGPAIKADTGHPSNGPVAPSHLAGDQAVKPSSLVIKLGGHYSQPASRPASCNAALHTQQAKNKFNPKWQLVTDFVAE